MSVPITAQLSPRVRALLDVLPPDDMAALRRYYPAHYELQAVTIDMGLPGMDFSPVAALCEKLEVPYQIKKTEIGPIIFDYRHEKNPCSMCAKMRRGALNDVLLTLGCNKIALGHHFSDVVETTVMGMFYGSQLQAMPPKLRSRNFRSVQICPHLSAPRPGATRLRDACSPGAPFPRDVHSVLARFLLARHRLHRQ